MMSCIYNHPKVMLTEHRGVKTFLHMTTDNFCFQWINPEGVEWDLRSFPTGSLLQKAPHLEMCWKMMDYDKWIINLVSPSQGTAALIKKYLLLCNLPLGLLPNTQYCSHKCSHPSHWEKMPGCNIYLFISEHRFLLEIYHLKARQEKGNFTPISPITYKRLLCDIQLWTFL